MIIEDTRQKAEKHENKHEYWQQIGESVVRSALPFGDYWSAPKIAIDTKQDISEIAYNMCGPAREKKRFREECKKAQEAGCKLIFLIEDRKYTAPDGVIGGNVWLHSGQVIPGDQVFMAMKMHEERYGCEFWFCDPDESGRVVMEILHEQD